jgi:peptidoglycan lytic transglycosylase
MERARMIRIGLAAGAASLLIGASAIGVSQHLAFAQSVGAAEPAQYVPPPQPPEAEMIRLRDGLAAASTGDWASLASLRDNARDPLVKSILEWRYAASQDAPLDFDDIVKAMGDLADWPARDAMRARAEQAIFTSRLSAAERIAFLQSDGGPQTGDGRVALAMALRHTGHSADAVELARKSWREDKLSDSAEDIALSEFGSSFTQADHADRVGILIWRGQRSAAARLMPRISATDRLVADARIALQTRRRRGLQRAVDAVPDSRQDDAGLLYDRTQYVRRAGRPERAIDIAARIDAREAPLVARDDIYREKRLYVPRALRAGDPRLALRLISNHGMSSGEDYADAEWLAGWLKLRFLHDAAGAAENFAHLDANVSAPVSRARALYWRAQAAKALGQSDEAEARLAEAARYDFTYYGQLAATRSGAVEAQLSLPQTAEISAEARAHFESRELVRALRLITQVGARPDFEAIAFYLDDSLEDPQEIELLSQMARDMTYSRTAIRSAKAGLFRGVVAANAAYPLLELPPSVDSPGRPERALVLAIIRQESEFDPSIISHAGARGLMQLMPATARLTARSEGVPYQPAALTNDPNYNITLGAAHLGTLIDEFNGSYVLAVAAYNAGSNRAREWIDDWGDPRSPSVDVVDWVELIPIAETRNYVQRVMENLQVYRHRLANAPTPIQLERDLRRGHI